KLGNKTDNAFRVIADHIRALVFAITDGATPSNEGRGYVIRRILRRASRFGRELGMHEPFIYELVPVVVDCLGDAFGEIRERADYVSTVIESEEASFGRTLDRGIEIFNAAAKRAKKSKDKTIDGEDAFQLYDTYGFPLDLTELMAQERNLKVDTTRFAELMEGQRQRAKAAQKTTMPSFVFAGVELPATDDSAKYETDNCTAKVVLLTDFVNPPNCKRAFIFDKYGSPASKDHIMVDENVPLGIVLDKTCFYAEAGGQVGDCGKIESSNCEIIVKETEKWGNTIVHKGYLIRGKILKGDEVTATVDRNREATKKNHTATHLLQWALQQVLGDSVVQQGSFVGPDYLRFDFTYNRAPTPEQLKETERLVREKIAADLSVTWTVMPIEKAKKLGAMALFGEKYGDEVRVVAVGAENKERINEAFSREFCGGTHVDRLGSIGGFKIVKEESISAGIRRITALTGAGLTDYLEKARDVVDELSLMLKVPSESLVERVGRLIDDNKKLSKELKAASRRSGSDAMAEARKLLDKCEKIGETSVITHQLSAASVEQAREAVDMLKKKAKSAAVVFGFDDNGKAVLLAGVTDDLVKKGLKAGDIVKEIAPIVDGGGGGRPQMAQAGGKNPKKIDAALARAVEFIKAKLGA
ncbi:MAG: alanine--tRNA ligase, partial [Phycisphaerales bacterium]